MSSFKEKLKQRKQPRKPWNVPDVGPCLLQGLTARQRGTLDDLPEMAKRLRTPAGILVRRQVLAWGLLDENGNPVFSDIDMQTVDELPSDVVEPVYDEIMTLSGVRPNNAVVTDPNVSPSTNGQAGAAPSA